MWYNKIMRWILRSPLHSMLSKNTLLLTYTGCKSGKTYTIPVNYVREEDKLWITSLRNRTWWRNLRRGVPVAIRYRGQDITGTGYALTAEADVITGLTAYLGNAPQIAKYFDVRLDKNQQPNPEDIVQVAQDRVIVRIDLEQ